LLLIRAAPLSLSDTNHYETLQQQQQQQHPSLSFSRLREDRIVTVLPALRQKRDHCG